MSERLRVLQIEDLESDAALLVRLLEKSGYEVDAERVEDAEEMRAALSGRTWDVIIADFKLPRFDAPAALRILHETGEDIPFIIVSGSIGEGLAVQLMKSGAHDYVMKDNPARLPPVVEREVREARARRERRRAEERLALAISATQLGTFDFYPQTGELIWSDEVKRQFGVKRDAEITYRIFLQGLHADDRERVERLIQSALHPESGGQFAAEYRIVGIEDGVTRSLSSMGQVFFDSQGRAARFIGVTLDVTEHKGLEDQFRQAQKLESIGRLAGGVAHDFNNLLTVISGYAQMVADELAAQHPLREPIREICRAAEHATALTRQLLTFSRRQVSEPKNIVLNDLVRDIEKMLRRLIGVNIDLVLETDPAAGALRADPGHIEQVIMNLVVNAKDAMPEGGKLLIQTARQAVDERFADLHLAVEPGDYVMLAVSDTGIGMSPEVKAHIFEPFFTTKEQGKGTGLGLSTVYGIVKQSEGAVWVYSEPGQGTTFKMLFPVCEAAATAAPVEAPAAVANGSGTVLLAEDEPGVRDFIKRALTKSGYTVLTAPNGREALALLRQHSGKVHLLLADVSMPEMGGVELAHNFAAEYPGVPILLMSGYAEGLWDRDDLPAGYLQKPFTSATLLAGVRGVMQA